MDKNMYGVGNATRVTRIPRMVVFASKPVVRGPFSAHRGIGDAIDHPHHGDSGWFGVDLYIYNGRYGNPGWLKLSDYQRRKVAITRRQDWRVCGVSGLEDYEHAMPTL